MTARNFREESLFLILVQVVNIEWSKHQLQFLFQYNFRESKSANISMAEAKRKAIINGRVRRLSDQVDHVKKTVQENSENKKFQAEQTIRKMNTRLQNAECKRSRRLKSISVRYKLMCEVQTYDIGCEDLISFTKFCATFIVTF